MILYALRHKTKNLYVEDLYCNEILWTSYREYAKIFTSHNTIKRWCAKLKVVEIVVYGDAQQNE